MNSFLEQCENKNIPKDEVVETAGELQKKGKIVFTNGCFDILHRGHIEYLTQARSLGDFLWVGLNSDQSVKKLKGRNRPINSEIDRFLMLSCFQFVDYITIFSEDTPVELLRLIKPNLHVKGGDYKAETLPEYSIVKSYGGEVQILSFTEGKSTSSIIQKIQSIELTVS